MKAVEIIDLLNQLEKKFEVDKWVIDGIHVWPLVRIDLIFNLHYDEFKNSRNEIDIFFKFKESLKILHGNLKYFFYIFLDHRQNDKIKKTDIIFLSDSNVRTFLRDRWFDRFIDPLIIEFGKKYIRCLMLEKSHRYLVPRYSSSIFIQPSLDYFLLKNYFGSKKGMRNVNLPDFDKFIMFIKNRNINIPIPTIKRLKTLVMVVKAYSSLFKIILKKTKPKIAFEVAYHNPVCMAFNLACREFGINSVEIQHGVQGDFHGAYGSWLKVPSIGYELLPSIFWCWDSNDSMVIEKWSRNVKKWHKPIVGGNPFLNFWQNREDEIIKFYDKNLLNLDKKHNILVTLSTIEEKNLKLLNKITWIMKTSPKRWKWRIRLHPCGLGQKAKIKKYILEKGVANFEMEESTSLPLYAILKCMDLHITDSSATVIDASYFGVPSIVVDEDGARYFKKQIKSGLVIAAYKREEIRKTIIKQMKKKVVKSKNIIESINNQEKAIDYLMLKINKNI